MLSTATVAASVGAARTVADTVVVVNVDTVVVSVLVVLLPAVTLPSVETFTLLTVMFFMLLYVILTLTMFKPGAAPSTRHAVSCVTWMVRVAVPFTDDKAWVVSLLKC